MAVVEHLEGDRAACGRREPSAPRRRAARDERCRCACRAGVLPPSVQHTLWTNGGSLSRTEQDRAGSVERPRPAEPGPARLFALRRGSRSWPARGARLLLRRRIRNRHRAGRRRHRRDDRRQRLAKRRLPAQRRCWRRASRPGIPVRPRRRWERSTSSRDLGPDETERGHRLDPRGPAADRQRQRLPPRRSAASACSPRWSTARCRSAKRKRNREAGRGEA